MIKKKTAVRLAGLWHSGQWSPFYQFSCSGYLPECHWEYIKETNENLKQAEGKSKRDIDELKALKQYFEAEGSKNGIRAN